MLKYTKAQIIVSLAFVCLKNKYHIIFYRSHFENSLYDTFTCVLQFLFRINFLILTTVLPFSHATSTTTKVLQEFSASTDFGRSYDKLCKSARLFEKHPLQTAVDIYIHRLSFIYSLFINILRYRLCSPPSSHVSFSSYTYVLLLRITLLSIVQIPSVGLLDSYASNPLPTLLVPSTNTTPPYTPSPVLIPLYPLRKGATQDSLLLGLSWSLLNQPPLSEF